MSFWYELVNRQANVKMKYFAHPLADRIRETMKDDSLAAVAEI